jgi:hypothetical protein
MHRRTRQIRWLLRIGLGACVFFVGWSARADELPLAESAGPAIHWTRQSPLGWPARDGLPFAENAMPGIHRVGFAAPVPYQWATGALTAGYGYTEPQGGGDSGHHRQVGRAAVAFWPAEWLGAGLRLGERYDYHPRDGTGRGPDDGWLVDPTLDFRAAFGLAQGLYAGPDVSVWLPGTERAGVSLDSTTVDARFLITGCTYHLNAGALAGFRFDQSAQAGKDAARMRPGDRLALGLSDFNAILLGAGASYAVKQTVVKGELTGDLLIGAHAPSIAKSPLRAAAGVEQILGRSLSLEGLLEFSLSARPSTAPGAPLVPVEPRITALVGFHYRPGVAQAEPPPAPPAPEPPKPAPAPPAPVPPPPATPTHVPLDVALVDDDGQPLLDARVTLEAGAETYQLTPAGQGKYHLEQAPVGNGKLHAEAPGYMPVDQPLLVGKETAEVKIRTQQALPSGQVRGLVRSFRGKPVKAKIRIEPVGTDTIADEQGFFQVDVQPGEYDVVIEAAGFTSQRRHVTVKERGVVVLNADLVEAKQ